MSSAWSTAGTVPVPFNLNSILALFPPRMADRLCETLIERFGFGQKVPILKLRTEADSELRFLADYVYANVFEGYTLKQWGMRPEELSPSVTARVPVFVSRDDRYFQDRYQAMPRDGYTALFERLLDHPRISVELNVEYKDALSAVPHDRTVFTGPIDEFFDYAHGPLPYRSLRFERRVEQRAFGLPVGTVNYPNEFDFTRITDQRHLSGEPDAEPLLITEYPEPYVVGVNEPYYPIPSPATTALLDRYLVHRRDARRPRVLRRAARRLRLLQHGSGMRPGAGAVREADRAAGGRGRGPCSAARPNGAFRLIPGKWIESDEWQRRILSTRHSIH